MKSLHKDFPDPAVIKIGMNFDFVFGAAVGICVLFSNLSIKLFISGRGG